MIAACSTLTLAVAACGVARQYESEVISGSESQVSVKAGKGANPGEDASAHCATYGKQAVLVRSEPVGGVSAQSANQSVYYFDCK